MPNPWGTAMQVLAGAFGQGASSLGKSRMDQARIDDENSRDDAQRLDANRRADERFDQTHQLNVDQAKARQDGIDLEREQTTLGRSATTAMLEERGFPPEVIRAIIYGGVSASTYLGPDGMYAGPGMRRGVTPARPTTPPGTPGAPARRFPSNGARPGVAPAAAPPVVAPAAAPPPPVGRSGRRPPPNVP